MASASHIRSFMRIGVFVVLTVFAVFGRAQNPDPHSQRIGDLLIEVTSITTPALATRAQLAPPPDHYWVVTELTFRNIGHEAICAGLTGSLKAEFGLTASDDGMILGGVTISELLPGEEVHGSLNFSLKRGANPLELTVETQSYGQVGCGSFLPPFAVRRAVFPIRPVRAVPSPAPALTGEAYPPPPSLAAPDAPDPLKQAGHGFKRFRRR